MKQDSIMVNFQMICLPYLHPCGAMLRQGHVVVHNYRLPSGGNSHITNIYSFMIDPAQVVMADI